MTLPTPPPGEPSQALQAVWDIAFEMGRWPTFAELDRRWDSQHDSDVLDVLRDLPADLGTGFNSGVPPQASTRIALTVAGAAACQGATEALSVFLDFIRVATGYERAWRPPPDDPAAAPVLGEQEYVRQARALPAAGRPHLLRLVFILLQSETSLWMGLGGPDKDGHWYATLHRNIRPFRNVTDLDSYWAKRQKPWEAQKGEPVQGSAEPPSAGDNKRIYKDSTSGVYEFDIAVSFAGEDREFVEQIVDQVKIANISVFYDHDFTAEMWGEELGEYLDDVYRLKARYAVIFISSHYAEKMWTIHERRSVLARALEDPKTYVLPVRLDDTMLPGLRPTVGYLDARQVGLTGVTSAILAKLKGSPPTANNVIGRVPRTEIERQQLLLERPVGWEQLYLVAQVLHEKERTETRYYDFLMGYAPPTGEDIDAQDAAKYLSKSMDFLLRLIRNWTTAMSPAAQERVLGPPGQAGNAEAIAHLAKRWNDSYIALMDWAEKLRSTKHSSEYANVFELSAKCVTAPIEQYREFIEKLVEQSDQIPSKVAAGEPVKIEVTLKIDIPDDISKALSEEISRLRTA